MATDTIRADSDSVNPNPRSKNRARTRARHPQRAPTYARARYLRVTHARGHARTRQAGRWIWALGRARRRRAAAAGTAAGTAEGGGYRGRRRGRRREAGTVSGGAADAGCGGLVRVGEGAESGRWKRAAAGGGDADGGEPAALDLEAERPRGWDGGAGAMGFAGCGLESR